MGGFNSWDNYCYLLILNCYFLIYFENIFRGRIENICIQVYYFIHEVVNLMIFFVYDNTNQSLKKLESLNKMSTHRQDFCVGFCKECLELDVEGDGALDGIRTLPSVVVPEVRHDVQAPGGKTTQVGHVQKRNIRQ